MCKTCLHMQQQEDEFLDSNQNHEQPHAPLHSHASITFDLSSKPQPLLVGSLSPPKVRISRETAHYCCNIKHSAYETLTIPNTKTPKTQNREFLHSIKNPKYPKPIISKQQILNYKTRFRPKPIKGFKIYIFKITYISLT